MANRRLLDAGLAGVVALAGVASVRGHAESAGEQVATAGYAVVVSVPLLWRRRWPLVMAWSIGLLGAVAQLSSISRLLDGPFLLSFAVAVGTVGALDLRRRSIGWTVLAVVPAFAVAGARTQAAGDLVGTAGWLILAFTVGRAIAFRRSAADARADAERAAQARALERRVADERLAIARDLHDVITQSVEAMSLQATAGLQLFDRSPDEARAALQRIRTVGRAASREIRELLGVLRSEDAGPMPGLDDLHDLVRSSSVDGPPASFRVVGEPRRCDALIGLTLYRVAQEALTNVRRHASAKSVTVELTWRAEDVVLTVTDDGAPKHLVTGSKPPGHGLRGMRERLELVDGELEAGAGPDGGFRVRATVPLESSVLEDL